MEVDGVPRMAELWAVSPAQEVVTGPHSSMCEPITIRLSELLIDDSYDVRQPEVYLRSRAAHFRHLAAGMDQETQKRLTELASEYERRAAALESNSAGDDGRDQC